MTLSQFAQGDLLFDKYQVEMCLGVGGMGTVLAARHLHLGQRVAIKLMHPNLAEQSEMVTRFLREGQAAARLRSPHVARVIDFGKSDAGLLFLVMEYLEGRDLEHMLAERGALPLEETIELLLQTVEAVAEAHSNGIVHRDLKPGNLFVTRDVYGCASVKVLDFGISKLVVPEPELKPATAVSAVMGTPVYMPPEQMRGAHAADHRADIWALGAILYECLTGKPAWSGATLNEVCVRVASDATPSVRQLVPSMPPAVDAIVARCLRKDPAERYQSVLDFGEALAALLPELGRPAMNRVYRLVSNDAPQNDHSSLTSTTRRIGSIRGGTSTAWGEPTRVRRVTRRFTLPPFVWKTAPALLLLITGGLAGTWWRWIHHTRAEVLAPSELLTVPASPPSSEIDGSRPGSTTTDSVEVSSIDTMNSTDARQEVLANKVNKKAILSSVTSPRNASPPEPPPPPVKQEDRPAPRAAVNTAAPPAMSNTSAGPAPESDGSATPDWGGRR